MKPSARWSVAVVAAAALAVGGTGTVAAAAPASLAVMSLGCDGGSGTYFCFMSWTGGVAPVSIRWFKNDIPVSAFNDRTFFLQTCVIGTAANIRVVVSDAAGGSDEDSRPVRCTLL